MSRLLSEAEERARNLLSANRSALDAVVARLLEKETISGDELVETVRQVAAASQGTAASNLS